MNLKIALKKVLQKLQLPMRKKFTYYLVGTWVPTSVLKSTIHVQKCVSCIGKPIHLNSLPYVRLSLQKSSEIKFCPWARSDFALMLYHDSYSFCHVTVEAKLWRICLSIFWHNLELCVKSQRLYMIPNHSYMNGTLMRYLCVFYFLL